MDINFYSENVGCCSLELHWNYSPKKEEKKKIDNISYELYQKEGGNHYITNLIYFKNIYTGKDTSNEVINLKPNQLYTFKLKMIKEEENLEKVIEVKTLFGPPAILSEDSVEKANGGIIEEKDKISNFQKQIIKIVVNLFLMKMMKIY